MRRNYLVTYDVADDRRRSRIFDTLRDHGDHVQYSVFLCELSPVELAALRSRLTQAVHPREDQVLIVDLGPATTPLDSGIESIGKPYDPMPKVFIV